MSVAIPGRTLEYFESLFYRYPFLNHTAAVQLNGYRHVYIKHRDLVLSMFCTDCDAAADNLMQEIISTWCPVTWPVSRRILVQCGALLD